MNLMEIVTVLLSSGSLIAFLTLFFKMGVFKGKVEERFSSIEGTLKRIDSTLDKLDTRLDRMESKLDSIASRLDRLEVRVEERTLKVVHVQKTLPEVIVEEVK